MEEPLSTGVETGRMGGWLLLELPPLVVAIAARREQRLSKIFTSLEKIWDEYHVYEKQEGGNGI